MTNDKQRVDFPVGENVSIADKRGTPRGRLVEILKECPSNYSEDIADHLLANGVIVPPCKVGDKAYFLIEDKVAGEKYISPEPITDVCTKGFYTSGHADSDENGDLWLWSDVGGIVFLDKTKAEEALKAREKDVIC